MPRRLSEVTVFYLTQTLLASSLRLELAAWRACHFSVLFGFHWRGRTMNKRFECLNTIMHKTLCLNTIMQVGNNTVGALKRQKTFAGYEVI